MTTPSPDRGRSRQAEGASVTYTATIEEGVNGIAHLMALAARPPKRAAHKAGENYDRPGKTLQMIKAWAAYGHYDAYGFDHPENPRHGNRSLSHFDGPMRLLFRDFQKAVDAGRTLRRSLYVRSFGAGEIIPLSFEGGPTRPFEIVSKPHTETIREAFEAVCEQRSQGALFTNVRRDLWDRWLPTIHVAGAFSLLFDSNFPPPTTPLPWYDFCRALLTRLQRPHLVSSLLTWAAEIEEAANEQGMFPRTRLVCCVPQNRDESSPREQG